MVPPNKGGRREIYLQTFIIDIDFEEDEREEFLYVLRLIFTGKKGLNIIDEPYDDADLVTARTDAPVTSREASSVLTYAVSLSANNRSIDIVGSGNALRECLGTAAIGSIPLPHFLASRLLAWEGDADGRYDFEVEIGLPLIGRVIRYAGTLDLFTATEPESGSDSMTTSGQVQADLFDHY